MKIAKQRVQIWSTAEEGYTWLSLREYLDQIGLTSLRPWRLQPGVTEAKCFTAPWVIDCDPGGLEYHGGNEYKGSRIVRTEREILCSRWKKGRCAYIYFTQMDGLYLMLPKPLKVTVEVKVSL